MTGIVQEPNDVLRRIAVPVSPADLKSKKLINIISDMKHALASEDDGVAIAAPQIGVPLRIFIVAKRVSKKFEKDLQDDMVFINPEIVRLGRKKEILSEGCLSVRWKYGLVKRSLTATVRAQNIDGNEFVMSASGLLAQIFQHEVDHLNGILFIDTATDIRDMPPEHHGKE